ncbi:unnamed protein product [Rhizophagus irregularis]|nr:unnamed protein product [Rhizophagus irregularis]
MKPLTPKTRGAIVYGHNCEQSSCTIAKQLGCGKTTVNDILKHFHETHSLIPKKQTGRPPLLNSPAQQELKEFVQENEQPVSAITIRRNLKKVGLTACIPCKKPALSEAHCQACLEWTHVHENWSARKWRRVLFSDESTFTQFQQGRQRKVWREPGKELNPDCISVTVKHSPSKMFLGCFSWNGLEPIVPLNGSVTGQTHTITIKDYVVPTLQRHFPQDENDGSHHTPPPSNIKVLEKYVKDAWKDIPPEYYKKLVNSMLKRIETVIAANGNRINY